MYSISKCAKMQCTNQVIFYLQRTQCIGDFLHIKRNFLMSPDHIPLMTLQWLNMLWILSVWRQTKTKHSLWSSSLKWLRSVQHYSSQLSFPEGSNKIVSCCCVVWDSDSNVPWGRRGTNNFSIGLMFKMWLWRWYNHQTDSESAHFPEHIQTFPHGFWQSVQHVFRMIHYFVVTLKYACQVVCGVNIFEFSLLPVCLIHWCYYM